MVRQFRKKMKVHLTDLGGKTLTPVQYREQVLFDLSELPDGIYLLVINYENKTVMYGVGKIRNK